MSRASGDPLPVTIVEYTPRMPALQESQRWPAKTPVQVYAALLAAFEEAYRNMKICSGNIDALLSEVNPEMMGSEWRVRTARVSQAYDDARAQCTLAAASLNEFLIAEIVSSSPAIRETASAAPDH